MKLSVCLVVKNEEETIEACLAEIIGAADEVLVLDTGSTDRTIEILHDRFHITPYLGALQPGDNYSIAPSRNFLSDRAKNPWVFKLDADERVSGAQLDAFRKMPENPAMAGYFVAWDTYLPNSVTQDYKLAIHRREVRHRGLVHGNSQIDLRMRGLSAVWLDAIRLLHYPPPNRTAYKFNRYRDRLEGAVTADPQWYRYHWFLGYQFFRDNQLDKALYYLHQAAASESRRFPVECLNSKMVLAEIHARRGDRDKVAGLLRGALDFHQAVADDFEVRVNFRMRPWIDRAIELCECDELEAIQVYWFAY